MAVTSEKKCEYCNGQGYVELLLGGSESCYACQGTGKAPEKQDSKTSNVQNINSMKSIP